MHASASDLPQELFRNILHYLLPDHDKNPRSRQNETQTDSDKRELSAYILTCADWAKRGRRLRLHEVSLRSADDVRTLTCFTTSPPSARFEPITWYLIWIDIEYSRSAAPWLHHVYSLLRLLGHPYVPESGQYRSTRLHLPAQALTKGVSLQDWRSSDELSIRLTIQTPQGDDSDTAVVDTWPNSSVHFGLPRNLPACYHAFNDIALHHLHFRSLGSLLRLVKELAGSLRRLELWRVTWDGSSAMEIPNPVRFPLRDKRVYFISGVSEGMDNVLAAILLFYQPRWSCSHNNSVAVAREDIQLVTRVIDWVYASYGPAELWLSVAAQRKEIYRSSVRIGVIGTLVNDYELLASSPHVTFHSTSHPRGVEATSLFEVQHIQHVVVEYFRRSYDMDGSPCNTIAEPDGGEAWMAFVDLMSRFPRLRSVVFAFDDEADKRAFVVRNSKALQQLQQSITTRLVDLPWPVGDRRKPSFVESDYYDELLGTDN